MKKTKIAAMVLIVCCIFSAAQYVFADSTYRYESESWKLYRLELFAGASPDRFNPDLGARLDRQIGITLLLNLFGETSRVKQLSSQEINMILFPYSDQALISSWGRPYMAYAVKTGMIAGTSPTTLGPLVKLDGVSFAAMILRFLGYSVERKDFPDSIRTLCSKGGLNPFDADYFNKPELIKDDAIGMAYGSLSAVCPNGEKLIDKLISSGIVDRETALSFNLLRNNEPTSVVASNGGSNERPADYQKVYDLITHALLMAETSIELPKNQYTEKFSDIVDIVDMCLRENPEILYYRGFTYNPDGMLTFRYSKDSSTILSHREMLESKVNEILAQIIRPDMTDYRKELAIHDYLVENCEYDMDAVNGNEIKPESFTAYGALCLGVAVCEGYAEAASILLNRAGVETKIITGASKGVGHAWNLVKIDGEFYHLDITWDDPYQADEKCGIRYYYFNLTDADISSDHQWDESKYEACTAKEYNYYKYNDMVVEDQDDYIERVIDEVQKGNTSITLKILEPDPKKFNIGSAVETIVNKLFLRCQYSYNKDVRIAMVSFY